ncbi:MAG: hypothetical protein K8R59_07065 [Thermoanaerobaculales bacterium]|nr:hypothetical protein [Thermoanaerobaculales bacterium]
MSRDRLRAVVFLVFWVGAIVMVRGFDHPLVQGFQHIIGPSAKEHGDSTEQRLQLFLAAVDATLDPETEIAYRWSSFRDLGYSALGASFITARYRLQPRTIYPLLSSADLDEIQNMVEIDRRLLDFLTGRAQLIGTGETGVPVVVALWGGQDSCHIAEWPNLVPGRRIGSGCILYPSVEAGAK